MWRYFALLLLASPLGYAAYLQAHALGDLKPPPPPYVEDEKLTSLIANLKERPKAARLSPEVHAALVKAADECPEPGAGAAPLDKEVAAALKGHAGALKDVRDFYQAHAGIHPGKKEWEKRFPAAHPYHDTLKERHGLLAEEQNIRELVKVFPGKDDALEKKDSVLEKSLESYGRRPDHNRDFLRETIALLDRKRLETKALAERKQLDETAKELDRQRKKVLPGKPGAALKKARDDYREKLTQAISKFGDYASKYKELPEYLDWSQAELRNLESRRTLLDLVNKDSDVSTPDGALVHLKGFADLSTLSATKEFRDDVRLAAIRFCDNYLPRKLPLDDYVLFKNVLFKRKDVRIAWKDATKPNTPVESPDHDEFALKEKEVDCFLVDNQAKNWPMKPTPKSEAAFFYNKNRDSLKWTKESLEQLHAACIKSYKTELADQIKRIDAILKSLEAKPTLFDTEKEKTLSGTGKD